MNGNPRGHQRIVAVSAFVPNATGDVLLVRTLARPDTWEMPGGRVETDETLDATVRREVLEETGMEIEPLGVSGVYSNVSLELLVVVFSARLLGGLLRTPPDEIIEAAFVPLEGQRLSTLVTRPPSLSRILDAHYAHSLAPYEGWELRPRPARLARVGPNRPGPGALGASRKG